MDDTENTKPKQNHKIAKAKSAKTEDKDDEGSAHLQFLSVIIGVGKFIFIFKCHCTRGL